MGGLGEVSEVSEWACVCVYVGAGVKTRLRGAGKPAGKA